MGKCSDGPLPFTQEVTQEERKTALLFILQTEIPVPFSCLMLKQVVVRCLPCCSELADSMACGPWQAGQSVLCLKVSAFIFIDLNTAVAPAHPSTSLLLQARKKGHAGHGSP